MFKFNQVLDPGSQSQVYHHNKHLIEGLFEGFNSTFLAYGQTGTGKTYTVFNEGLRTEDQGFFYQAVEDLFVLIKKRMHLKQFAVRVSFAEFYLDSIQDLLDESGKVMVA